MNIININNKVLSGSFTVNSADDLVLLKTDIDCSYDLVLEFSNGSTAYSNFVKRDDEYITRLTLKEDNLKGSNTALLYVIMNDGPLSENTNKVQVKLNKALIEKTIKKMYSDELLTLRKDINELQRIVNSLSSSKILQGINITNSAYVQKGMIPVAVNDKGDYIACYPFVTNVQKVNNQEPINGLVNLDASMIEYKSDRTIREAIDEHVKAIVAQNNSIKQLTDTVKQLANRLDQLTIDFETYKNNGIL